MRSMAFFVIVTGPMIASPALAHDGLHHHPHGIDYGWIIAAAVGLTGGYALTWWRGRT